jgi:hypothetical protein
LSHFGPFREVNCTVPSENKSYFCRLFQPHVLTLAINEAFPAKATQYAVNIGAGDGKGSNDPVYPLFAGGYSGLAVEGAENPALRSNLPSDKIIKRTGTFVTPHNVGALLEEARCPQEADFFKIDIDGYDGVILDTVLSLGYRPKVLQMEVNPEIPPPIRFSVLYDPAYRWADAEGKSGGFYGVSAAYAAEAAKPYDYVPVHLDFVTDWTHDLTLVRSDFLEVASDLFGNGIRDNNLREMFLSHPPGWSHFIEYGIDSLKWRYRTDYHELLIDIWKACQTANVRKHGSQGVPFHLSF